MSAKMISDQDFAAQVENSKGVVLVDFWAEWCGPCKMLLPIVEELANELKGKVTVAKVNIDENPNAPTKYGVRSIPTLILFKDGKPVATRVGVAQKTQLKEWIDSQVA